MMAETTTTILAWLLIVAAIVNAYFVYDGARLYLRSHSRSEILLAFFLVKLVIWLGGLFLAVVSARYLAELPPLPFSGVLLGFVLLGVSLIPGAIHILMRRLSTEEDERDAERDAGRDAGRDAIRDPARDAARDAERDA